MRGGPDEEVAERRRWIEAEQKKINDSVQALINKRKLYKPVGTSEKEAEGKKKTKEDEEVAKLVCTSKELLNLEKKKKSDVSSSCSSSASSSSDEEVENDGTGQKGAEKSDGRRPMAEKERKAYTEIAPELLLPRRTEILETPPKLIEEITETEEYAVGYVDPKRQGKKILDERRSINDPRGGYALGRELAHYEKLVLGTTNETEIAPGSCMTDQNKDDDTNDQTKLFKSSSISRDNLDCNDIVKNKEMKIMENQGSCKDIINDYQRKNDRHPLSSQLSGIRKDMKEFCADMDKFVEENKICFKNGYEEKQSSISIKGEDNFKGWNTKERKSKVVEIMKRREEEAKKKTEVTVVTEDLHNIRKTDIVEDDPEKVSDERASQNKRAEEKKREVTSSQGVYDMLNLKLCSKLIMQDVKTYPENEDNSTLCKSPAKEKKEEAPMAVFHSLFHELDHKNLKNTKFERAPKSHSSHELFAIEETEETAEEIARDSSSVRRCVSTGTILSNTNNLKTENKRCSIKKEPVQTDILEVNSDEVTFVNSTDDDDSDNESVKTVIDLHERLVQVNEETMCSVKKLDVVGNVLEKKESSINVQVEKNKEKGQSSDIQALNALIASFRADKSNHVSKSCKRAHDCEYLNVASKKSHLIEDVDSETNPNDRDNGRDTTNKCKKHLMREARKFMRKESSLIDKCIENLITNKAQGNWKSTDCDQTDFLTSTAVGLISTKCSSLDISENSRKPISSNERSQEEESVRNDKDIQSITQLLKESEIAEKRDSLIMNGLDFYQEFCQHLEQLKSGRKLLIEPDFMKGSKIDLEEKKRDVLSSRETKQSKKKQTKPLIEEISQNPTNVDDIEGLEEPPVHAEDSTMDTVLKDRILKSISAPKSEEQMEKARKSAEKLMKISRDAMAVRKSFLQQSSVTCNQELQFDDSRKFFMNLMRKDPVQDINDVDLAQCATEKNELNAETEKVVEISDRDSETNGIPEALSIDDIGNQENEISDTKVWKTRKNLEMQKGDREGEKGNDEGVNIDERGKSTVQVKTQSYERIGEKIKLLRRGAKDRKEEKNTTRELLGRHFRREHVPSSQVRELFGVGPILEKDLGLCFGESIRGTLLGLAASI
ncbi:uncharacterized protein LOC122403114 [Colletes gigas]|uniref:uncharacterized protein LOC122403114 n=1 Tax=Colletes gigas TaxID=935657 RepID=UPI001C9AC1F0|nr:uncharacterized protein LOC122403114 [Colletes gigas]